MLMRFLGDIYQHHIQVIKANKLSEIAKLCRLVEFYLFFTIIIIEDYS